LLLNVVKTAQLPRHWQRKVQQPAGFGRTGQRKARSEWRNVDEARHLDPLMIVALATVYADRQSQFQALAHPI
jgi:hypothetical protein